MEMVVRVWWRRRAPVVTGSEGSDGGSDGSDGGSDGGSEGSDGDWEV